MTGFWMQGQELGTNREADSWERVNQIRDKFEYDRDRRMREKGWFWCVGLTFGSSGLIFSFPLIDCHVKPCISRNSLHPSLGKNPLARSGSPWKWNSCWWSLLLLNSYNRTLFENETTTWKASKKWYYNWILTIEPSLKTKLPPERLVKNGNHPFINLMFTNHLYSHMHTHTRRYTLNGFCFLWPLNMPWNVDLMALCSS